MKRGLKGIKWMSLAIGVLLIITGVIFYMNPMETLVSLSYWLVAIFIATGIMRIVRYFVSDIFKHGSFLIIGIVEVLLGILMIYTQPVTALTLAVFIGFWQLFTGVSEIATSLDLKNLDFPRWWIGAVSGVLGIILGFMLIKNPGLSRILISVYAIIYGITFISTFFAINSISKKLDEFRGD